MPPESSETFFSAQSLQVDRRQHLARLGEPLLLGHPGELEPERDVLDDAAPGQQRELLEHHRHRAAPEAAQRVAASQVTTSTIAPSFAAHQHPPARSPGSGR